ncbi:hypothetical protein KCP69_24895 [Salmonella enterica subsp. enterica]|nr:hypothetical protein KCP69_24895 [Salmonella enterica subsp. enterica]
MKADADFGPGGFAILTSDVGYRRGNGRRRAEPAPAVTPLFMPNVCCAKAVVFPRRLCSPAATANIVNEM